MRVVRTRPELSQEGRRDGADVRHPGCDQHLHVAHRAHDGCRRAALLRRALARQPRLPRGHSAAAREFPRRLAERRRGALPPPDRGPGAHRARAVPLDSPALQRPERRLPELLRPPAAAAGLSGHAAGGSTHPGPGLLWRLSPRSMQPPRSLFRRAGNEGNRPVLLTNLAQLLVAPLYLIAELAFALGLRRNLRSAIERRLGARACA